MKPQLTLEAFADWCAKQPAEKEYTYINNRNCAFCQYLRATGISVLSVGPENWTDTNRKVHPLPAFVEDPLAEYPHTFGALAARLRHLGARP